MAANTPSLPLLEFPVDVIHYIADFLTDGELFFWELHAEHSTQLSVLE
jgi:hypothetical protein